jgi:hypothetical protein
MRRKPEVFPCKTERVPGVCVAEDCERKVYEKGSVRSRYCTRHRSIRARKLDPAAAYFNDVRHHARQRRIPFALTLAEWREWSASVGFFSYTSEDRANRMSVDRIDPSGGYTLGNIQALTVSANAQKAVEERGRRRLDRLEALYGVSAVSSAEETGVEETDEEEALLARI